MPQFFYTAIDSSGNRVSGTVSAPSRAVVLEEVRLRGLRPVSIEEKQHEEQQAGGGGIPGRISQASVESFTRELANLLTAGVPLSKALDIVAREAAQPAARRRWSEIRDEVMGGSSLAAALSRWPELFSPVYVAMVRAGETGGFLNTVLEQIAEFRSREQDLKGRVKAALVYPSLLACLAAGVLAFLLVFFIPRFASIFSDFGGSLPGLTHAIMAASGWLMKHGIALAASVAVCAVVARRALESEAGQRIFERVVLRIPGVGRVTARFALVRFCRMLGTLLAAGVPLVTSLTVAREAVGNRTLADTVTRAIDDVKAGSSLARSLGTGNRLFPAAVSEMIAVAEESGRLDAELVRIASAYEADLDRHLRMLVAVIEPALLFIMAAIVGTVVVGMLLPVFTLQELIR